MSFRTTIVLLVLLIVVGGYFFYIDPGDDNGYEQPNDTGDEIGSPLFEAETFDDKAVEKVTIDRDGKTVVIEKDGSDWKQVQPVTFAVNSWTADRFGQSAAALRYVKRFTPGDGEEPELDQMGLSPPKARVTFIIGGETKTTRTLKLGKKLSIGGRGYVMLGDDPEVYVVDDPLHTMALDQKPSEWRNKSLSGPKESQADRVNLTRDGTPVELVKTDGTWALGAPDSGRVDTQAVAGLCDAVGRIYVNEFVKDQPADISIYGLDEPTTSLRIQVPPITAAVTEGDESEEPAGEPEVTILRVGAPASLKKEHFFATLTSVREGKTFGDDVVFTIGKSDVEKLAKSADDLRDPRITLVKAREVNELRIDRASTAPIVVTRGDEGWKFSAAENPPYDPDAAAVSDLIDAIVDSKADAYTSAPTGQPTATVTLTTGGRPEPDVLKVFESDRKKRHVVVRNNETTGYLTPTKKLQGLFEPVLSLRHRTILALATDRVNRISLARPDGLKLVFSRAPVDAAEESAEPESGDAKPAPPLGPWTLAGHDKFESKALDELVEAIDPLRAERWVTEPGEIGKDVFELTVAAVLGEASTLRIDPTTRKATAEADDAFEVKQSLVDALNAEFRYRTVIEAANDDIEQVAVSRGDDTVTIEKDEDGKYVSVDGDQLDQAAAGGLFDTLAGLRVERYVKPLTMQDQDAAARITLRTKDQKTCVLRLAGKEGQTDVATIEPAGEGLGWFKLSEDALGKLTGELVKEEE